MKRVILEDLYNGKLCPADKSYLSDPKIRQLMDTAADSEEKLLEMLKGNEKDLFVTFSEAETDINYMFNLERYIDGFCMGMKLAFEVMGTDDK